MSRLDTLLATERTVRWRITAAIIGALLVMFLLWASLAKRMQHLGGQSAPYFLRMVGKDTFVLTDSVARGLAYWEVRDGPPRGKAEIAALQAVFNRWQEETGRPLCQLSQILALSID